MRIGIDLGGTNVRAGIVDREWNISAYRRELFRNDESVEETLTQLKDFIRPLIQPGVAGIGIGVPSVVDVKNGIVYNVTNIPSWKRVSLRDILEEEFKLPVALNNDVNCFALGEFQHGALKGYTNAVGITCGTGLGAGIIINRQIFNGTNCGAGEVGLISYLDHTIEYYASGNLFKVKYGTSAEEANTKASTGDPHAQAMWNEFGRHLGEALKTVTYAYDPEAIVIGGSLSKAFPLFEKPMREAMKSFEFPESIARLRILQSTTEHINLLGAAALVISGD